MENKRFNLLLADDDIDDCTFFKDALEDLSIYATLSIVNDGVKLMDFLSSSLPNLPDILFLDLNMPRKGGFECLSEIKANDKLKHLPVIIFSTSLDMGIVNLLYQNGAQHYICKPGGYIILKKVILEAITLTPYNTSLLPPRDKFIIQT
ncbi:MAG: response regulator [Ferruginibacter sp.]